MPTLKFSLSILLAFFAISASAAPSIQFTCNGIVAKKRLTLNIILNKLDSSGLVKEGQATSSFTWGRPAKTETLNNPVYRLSANSAYETELILDRNENYDYREAYLMDFPHLYFRKQVLSLRPPREFKALYRIESDGFVRSSNTLDCKLISGLTK